MFGLVIDVGFAPNICVFPSPNRPSVTDTVHPNRQATARRSSATQQDRLALLANAKTLLAHMVFVTHRREVRAGGRDGGTILLVTSGCWRHG